MKLSMAGSISSGGSLRLGDSNGLAWRSWSLITVSKRSRLVVRCYQA